MSASEGAIEAPIRCEDPKFNDPTKSQFPGNGIPYCKSCGDDWPCTGVIKPTVPEIVCLCGSTRFGEAFADANRRLTLEGRIVLSVGECTRAQRGVSPQEAFGEDAKVRLDELHKRKIDLADRVLVLNVGGYIGDSTRSEIAYAEAHDTPITYLEPEHGPSIAEVFPGAEAREATA